jgi:hypothetical protein
MATNHSKDYARHGELMGVNTNFHTAKLFAKKVTETVKLHYLQFTMSKLILNNTEKCLTQNLYLLLNSSTMPNFVSQIQTNLN